MVNATGDIEEVPDMTKVNHSSNSDFCFLVHYFFGLVVDFFGEVFAARLCHVKSRTIPPFKLRMVSFLSEYLV